MGNYNPSPRDASKPFPTLVNIINIGNKKIVVVEFKPIYLGNYDMNIRVYCN